MLSSLTAPLSVQHMVRAPVSKEEISMWVWKTRS